MHEQHLHWQTGKTSLYYTHNCQKIFLIVGIAILCSCNSLFWQPRDNLEDIYSQVWGNKEQSRTISIKSYSLIKQMCFFFFLINFSDYGKKKEVLLLHDLHARMREVSLHTFFITLFHLRCRDFFLNHYYQHADANTPVSKGGKCMLCLIFT